MRNFLLATQTSDAAMPITVPAVTPACRGLRDPRKNGRGVDGVVAERVAAAIAASRAAITGRGLCDLKRRSSCAEPCSD
jgi:hypothetical protein